MLGDEVVTGCDLVVVVHLTGHSGPQEVQRRQRDFPRQSRLLPRYVVTLTVDHFDDLAENRAASAQYSPPA